jgi:3-hydroxybutyryl-CoA dehydratase
MCAPLLPLKAKIPMSNPAELRFDDIVLQQEAHFTYDITEEAVQQFAKLTGDLNPLHMDEAYADTTLFKGRIAHGLLCTSLFSQLVGMHLPGKYALYLSQKVTFRKPCRIGMRVVVKGTVIQKVSAAKSIILKTEIINEANGECLIDGEAQVALLA